MRAAAAYEHDDDPAPERHRIATVRSEWSDVDAVPLVVDHPRYTADLPFDPSEPLQQIVLRREITVCRLARGGT